VTNHQRNLKQLISSGMYAVENRSVASAIIARASVREAVPGTSFRSDGPSGTRSGLDGHGPAWWMPAGPAGAH